MADTIKQAEVKTSYDYPEPEKMQLEASEGSLVARREKAGIEY